MQKAKVFSVVNLIRRHEADLVTNGGACEVREYDHPTTDKLGAAEIEISGRYPDEGWVCNTACEALIHVIKGHGNAYFTDHEVTLAEGDQLHIPSEQQYALKGVLHIIYMTAPKWSPEQQVKTSEEN